MGMVDDALNWAGRIAKAGWGEKASITRTLKSMPELIPDSAVRQDIKSVASAVVDNAKAYNGIGEEALSALEAGLKEAKELTGADRLAKEASAYIQAAKTVTGSDDEVYSAAIKKFNEKLEAFSGFDGNGMITLGQAEQYFGRKAGSGLGLNTARALGNRDVAVTAGAVYGGAAIGTRVLSGGSLTTNSSGERDIVGVPFI